MNRPTDLPDPIPEEAKAAVRLETRFDLMEEVQAYLGAKPWPRARKEGYLDRMAGKTPEDNPYAKFHHDAPMKNHAHSRWIKGWTQAGMDLTGSAIRQAMAKKRAMR